jgi:hypothetical protein
MAIVLPQGETSLARIVMAIRQLTAGRSNATGSVTLATSVSATTVSAVNCSPKAAVILTPQTAHAASALATTFVAAANVSAGQFIITHASNGQTDRTFFWAAFGG